MKADDFVKQIRKPEQIEVGPEIEVKKKKESPIYYRMKQLDQWVLQDFLNFFYDSYFEKYKVKASRSALDRRCIKIVCNRLDDNKRVKQYIEKYFSEGTYFGSHALTGFVSDYTQKALDFWYVNKKLPYRKNQNVELECDEESRLREELRRLEEES